jgi:hypothetical protein
MTTELPIACSLTAADMPGRLAEAAAIGRAGLLGVEATEARAVLHFRADADTRARLAAIVAAEAECCPFLAISLDDGRGALALTIEAPPGAEPVLRDLVAAFG